MKKFIPTNEKVTVSDYPYGFTLRTTLFDTVDFDPKKGYRHVTQTINPKNGRENKPKKGTYSAFLVRYYDEKGHIKTKEIHSFGGEEKINEGAKFLNDNFDLFTEQEREYFYGTLYVASKINMMATMRYKGAKMEDLTPFYDKNVEALKEGLSSKGTVNVFNKIFFDREAIEKTFPAEYQPFK